MGLADLPYLTELQARPRATGKGLPHRLAKKAAQKTKDALAEEFRHAVWKRDKGCSRATGKPLVRSGTTDWARLGEVDHSIPRSLAPELVYDVANGLLLSKEENRLRKVACVQMPEYRMFSYTGPADRSEPQLFTWRDLNGRIVKERWG